MSMTIQSSVKDKILATLSKTSKVENAPVEMLRDLDQQMEKRADDGCTLWIKLYSKYEYEIRYHPGKANVYGVRGMILAAQSEAFKQENVLAEILHGLDQQMERKGEREFVLYGSYINNSKEWNSGDDQLRFRWMIYFVVLADAAESVSDEIGFEYCLTSLSGLLDTTYKVVLIKENLKVARDRQKSHADNRRKLLEFEVGDRVMLKVSPWKGVICFGKKGKLAPRKWISDKRTKNKVKNDKTEHGIEKREKYKEKVKAKSKSRSTPTKLKVKTEAVTEETLNGPPLPI
ncbi:hypothetical protein Tco_0786770 [Tanacetum coccineum]